MVMEDSVGGRKEDGVMVNAGCCGPQWPLPRLGLLTSHAENGNLSQTTDK